MAVVALARPEVLWGDHGRDRLAALDEIWSTAEPDGRIVWSALHAVRIGFGSPEAAFAWAEDTFRAMAALGWGQLRGAIVAGGAEIRVDPETGRSDLFGPGVGEATGLAELASPGELLLDDVIGETLPRRARATRVSCGWSVKGGSGGPVPPLAPLPAWRSTFVGRTSEIAEALEHLRTAAVVQLVGPGGAGKTRTAVEVVRTWAGASVFVGLDAARTAAEVLWATALAIGVELSGDLDPVQATAHLGLAVRARGELVVVLDNVEQVAAEGVALVRELVAAAPELRVLLTSRVRLELGAAVPIGGLPSEEAIHLLRAAAGGSAR